MFTSRDDHIDLDLMLDFNVSPGIAVLGQEQVDKSTGRGFTAIIDEIYIEKDSNTPRICREIKKRWERKHGKKQLRRYGDATGGARKTSQTAGTDWDLVKNELRNVFRLVDCVELANPPERSRIATVNSRLESASGYVAMKVDRKCIITQRDFEGVIFKKNGLGEIDKEYDRHLTHASDAVGYRECVAHPIISAEGSWQTL